MIYCKKIVKILAEKLAALRAIKLSKWPLALGALGLLVLLGLAGFLYSRNRSRFSQEGFQSPSGWGQRPGGAEDFGGPPPTTKKPRWSGLIPNPPRDKITFYKGLWGATWIYPEEHTGLKLEPEKYKSWGVNIVNISPGFEINSQGEVRYPPDFPSFEDLDARIGELAEKFYQSGLHLAMTVQVAYKEDFSQAGDWAGVPVRIPENVVSKEGYLDNFSQVVEAMAKVAQKYRLEMFAPMNEPENIFGVKVAASWNQEILSKVKKQYTGKIYYKGDLHQGEGDQMSLQGYDVLGMVTSPVDPQATAEEVRAAYAADMSRALAWARRDQISEVVIAEHGDMGGDKMESAVNIGLALEEGSNKLNGVFLTEPTPAVLDTAQGEQIVAQAKKWFLVE